MKWLFILPGAFIVIVVAISFYLQPNSFYGCGEQPSQDAAKCQEADAIVVVSGGDTVARTDEAIKLFRNGWGEYLVLSGAAQDKTGPSNAEAMRIQAEYAGVPASAILTEELSETTEQNAINSQKIFAERNFDSVILVTSGYHQRRAYLEFEKRAENVQVLNHPLHNDMHWSPFWWITPIGWWFAGGELVKITAFYIQGLQS